MKSPFMDEALDLAKRGVGCVSPNPAVGAVLVRDGKIVGRGFHTYTGVKHAEVVALEAAGKLARGATLYVTLEPCCHVGRTAPCADAVIEAGVTRVVAAMQDPNPAVSGQGFEKLRAAGVAVELAPEYQEAASRLNEAFVHAMRTGRPLVTMKAALTLDGKIAARSGDTGWITSERARRHAQMLRHNSDVIVTGIGTVLADDPLLTDRTGLERSRPLLRVVFDSTLRVPLDSQLVRTAAGDLRVVAKPSASRSRRAALEQRGVEVLEADSLVCLLERLAREHYRSVLLEAGAALNGSALDAGLVDKVFFYYAPKILGGDAVSLTRGITRPRGGAIGLERVEIHVIGEGEFVVEGYVHRDH